MHNLNNRHTSTHRQGVQAFVVCVDVCAHCLKRRVVKSFTHIHTHPPHTHTHTYTHAHTRTHTHKTHTYTQDIHTNTSINIQHPALATIARLPLLLPEAYRLPLLLPQALTQTSTGRETVVLPIIIRLPFYVTKSIRFSHIRSDTRAHKQAQAEKW
jgi:hypothetical protein